ncbi:glycosyltransferase family 2 protein [Komagataeibacter europaeus]|uniref:glycosyltransferase family 2 protein n=1 Tax=Komagataeibacter europaeus TaxID=33995 RepID=UPI0002EECB6C|nr:glycosyltransferase family 2 protein [Komagataeibacter europaeus]
MPDLISLVVPCYNESSAVIYFSETINPVLEKIPNTIWEIIFIDDGSNDDTLHYLMALAEQDSRYRIIELSRNFGKEAAMTAGIDEARGKAIVIMDADLQDPPELIEKMIQQWRQGAEVVVGKRVDRSSDNTLKRVTASWFYAAHNRLSSPKIPNNVGDFRLMDRCVVEALKQLPERQRFMKGLFAWVGFRTVILDYVRVSRSTGCSKFSGFALWNLALEGFTSFSTLPIRIWTYVGSFGAFLALLYGVYIVCRTLLFGNPVPGYSSLFFAVVLLGSVQIMSVGILGEYIGRIYIETKARPIYIVRKLHSKRQTQP